MNTHLMAEGWAGETASDAPRTWVTSRASTGLLKSAYNRWGTYYIGAWEEDLSQRASQSYVFNDSAGLTAKTDCTWSFSGTTGFSHLAPTGRVPECNPLAGSYGSALSSVSNWLSVEANVDANNVGICTLQQLGCTLQQLGSVTTSSLDPVCNFAPGTPTFEDWIAGLLTGLFAWADPTPAAGGLLRCPRSP